MMLFVVTGIEPKSREIMGDIQDITDTLLLLCAFCDASLPYLL